MVGETLGHYRILDRLGAGGMGVVYAAHDERLDRRVALKVLSTSEQTRERLERLRREARSLAAVNHRNIVTVYSVEEVGGTWFVTMELVEGQTLDRVIPAGGLALNRFYALAIPIAEAVAAAHASGITHRDLKPGNVMVTERGEVKVLDFGLAKRTAIGDPELTSGPTEELLSKEGAVVGTLAYMSPEQLNARDVDHRSDIFSLGVVFFQMLTGRRPFHGDSAVELISAILRDPPDALHRARAGLPSGFGAMVERCLAKAPESRFQDCAELLAELEELARGARATENDDTRASADPRSGSTGSSPSRATRAGATAQDEANEKLRELRVGLLSAGSGRELRKLEAEIAAFVAGHPTNAEGLLLQDDIASARARQATISAAPAAGRSPAAARSSFSSSPWMRVAVALFLLVGSGVLFVGVMRQRSSSAPSSVSVETGAPAETAAPAQPSAAAPVVSAPTPSETEPVEEAAAGQGLIAPAPPSAVASSGAPTPSAEERMEQARAIQQRLATAQRAEVQAETSAPPEAIVEARETLAVLEALERYRLAWQRLDLEAILQIHPSAAVTAKELRRYQSATLEISGCQIEVERLAAVAKCSIVRTMTPSPTSAEPTPATVTSRHDGFRLAKVGGRWQVVEFL
jgi:serine/threonine protein kinase